MSSGHIRTELRPIFIGFGARIFFVRIQVCKVCLEMRAARAACFVVFKRSPFVTGVAKPTMRGRSPKLTTYPVKLWKTLWECGKVSSSAALVSLERPPSPAPAARLQT